MGKRERLVISKCLVVAIALVATARGACPACAETSQLLPAPRSSSRQIAPAPHHRAARITAEDVNRVCEKTFITLAGPADASPEELVMTLLADPTLPHNIRAPFAALVEAKQHVSSYPSE